MLWYLEVRGYPYMCKYVRSTVCLVAERKRHSIIHSSCWKKYRNWHVHKMVINQPLVVVFIQGTAPCFGTCIPYLPHKVTAGTAVAPDMKSQVLGLKRDTLAVDAWKIFMLHVVLSLVKCWKTRISNECLMNILRSWLWKASFSFTCVYFKLCLNKPQLLTISIFEIPRTSLFSFFSWSRSRRLPGMNHTVDGNSPVEVGS